VEGRIGEFGRIHETIYGKKSPRSGPAVAELNEE
jgi:hypothetical protein